MIDGKVLLGRLSKIGGSVAGHIFVPFMVYSAVEDGTACRKGNSDACVSLGGDVTFLATEVAVIAVESLEGLGVIAAGASAVAGPLSAVVGAVVFLGTDIYFAVERVDKENKIIPLKKWEKFTEVGRAFIGMNPDSKIQELMEEKQANNLLVQQALEFLKNNTDIQAYVFPTGKFVIDSCIVVQQGKQFICGGGTGACQEVPSYTQKCTTKLQLDPDNIVDLDTERAVRYSRARPDQPKGGELFCVPEGTDGPMSSSKEHRCKKAIGVKNGTGTTLISFGDGDDTIVGFSKGSKHIVVLGDGYKDVVLGDGDDTVLLKPQLRISQRSKA